MIELNEEQRIIRDSVARYLEEQYAFDQRQRQLESPAGYDPEQWTAFADLGWLGLPVPEIYGGYGGSIVETAVVYEQLGRALHRSPFLTCMVGADVVLRHSDEKQKEDILSAIAGGQRILSCALITGADSRIPYNGEAVTATVVGGEWELDGVCNLVPYAGAASDFLVAARFDTGTGVVLVPSDAKGVSIRHYRMYDGSRAGDIELSRVRVDRGALLNLNADEVLVSVREHETAMLCVEASALMWAVQEQTLEYMKTREQFGHRLSEFQALQHRAVDMYVDCQLAQSMAWDAMEAVAGDPDPVSRSRRVSAAKSYIGETGRKVGKEGLQLHGGIGMTNDVPVGHYLKRLTAIDQLCGDSALHRKQFTLLGESKVESSP